MDPLVTSTLISTGANMLGGLLGRNKGPKPMSDKDMLGWNQANFENMFESQMRMANKHGIHPLVMLGQNPGAGQATPVFSGEGAGGPTAGDFLSQAGQGVSRAVEAWMTRDMRAAQREMVSLDIEHKRLQNARLAAETRLMTQPGTPPGIGPERPRSIFLRDRDGKLTEVLNPEAGDNEFLMAQDWITRTLPQDLKNMSRRTADSLKRALTSPRSPGGMISKWLRR